MTSELMKPDELAARLGTTPGVLAQWRFLGRGPKFIKAGRAVRYRASDVEAWLDAQTQTQTGQLAHG